MVTPSNYTRVGQLDQRHSAEPTVQPKAIALAILILCAALAGYLATDRYFAPIEDETIVISDARLPLAEFLGSIAHGEWPHEHPPLPDVLLHAWLPIGGGHLWSLRLPSIVFFLCGLLVLAFAARNMGGQRAFAATIAIGLLWPFAFHFARLAIWYSLCFLLVSFLTTIYLAYLANPRRWVLGAFVGTALLLLYTNYYGWIVIGCLGLDLLVFRRQRAAWKTSAAVLATLAIGFLPMWPTFIHHVLDTAEIEIAHLSLLSRAVTAVYNFYSLFVSESVAPWFWLLSVPAGLGIVAAILSSLFLLPADARRFLGYFALLFLGLCGLGIVTTKRLLGISPWLILPLAIAVGQSRYTRARGALVVGLCSVAAIGWYGTITRSRYASAHFIEPWTELAAQAATVVARDGIVISNSPAFLFEMNYSMRDIGLIPRSVLPGWIVHPRVFSAAEWSTASDPRANPVLFVRGVNSYLPEKTIMIDEWLRANCGVIESKRLVPDSGYSLKQRFFRGSGQQPYRIDVLEYDCRMSRQ
jgi:hypothetical protein